ncbi:hypothetical protein CR159_15845 [Pollutimonas subterranea]|uniref:Prepilin type IV endopeptidase peptidase domain-containing protein n=1 Tax=Pollutimonas subterranea TaxID=2045210 RepID=A0A2N4U1C6_9BURK|nr:A24 family peptidase [Pollutimonas subterranea]PLC48815.1 hypothetical protein CR159_15845 [Pollutimonas subterranea]
MQETLYTMATLVPAAVLGGLAGAYCALVADAYVAALMAGGEPDSPCLRRALGRALQPTPQKVVATFQIMSACTVLMASCFAILGLVHGYTLFSLALAVASATLLILALIDAHTRLLPDALTLPLMWAGLALAWGGFGISLGDAVAGAMAGYGFLWSLFWVFKCLSGREGMGYGDFKLLAALGAWLGWRALAMVLLASCVAAVLFAMLRQRSLAPDGAYPFGPFLAASGTAGLLLGSYLIMPI